VKISIHFLQNTLGVYSSMTKKLGDKNPVKKITKVGTIFPQKNSMKFSHLPHVSVSSLIVLVTILHSQQVFCGKQCIE